MVDYYIGSLVNDLKQLGILDRTLIVITSDHGEQFFEHGANEHGNSFYDEVLRVPLIFRLPEKIPSGLRIPFNVSNIDIKPTILDVLGIDNEIKFEGKSLMSFFNGNENQNRSVFSEQERGRFSLSLRDDRYKIIFPTVKPDKLANIDLMYYKKFKDGEFYDIKRDPEEKNNLIIKENEISKKMRKKNRFYF